MILQHEHGSPVFHHFHRVRLLSCMCSARARNCATPAIFGLELVSFNFSSTPALARPFLDLHQDFAAGHGSATPSSGNSADTAPSPDRRGQSFCFWNSEMIFSIGSGRSPQADRRPVVRRDYTRLRIARANRFPHLASVRRDRPPHQRRGVGKGRPRSKGSRGSTFCLLHHQWSNTSAVALTIFLAASVSSSRPCSGPVQTLNSPSFAVHQPSSASTRRRQTQSGSISATLAAEVSPP